jgi:serine beta-lactamase-like protein LACTB, mitochondrial
MQSPLKQWPITTRELLSHTSGIRHYRDDEIDSTRHYKVMFDGFAVFANAPLLLLKARFSGLTV